ncbi:MAG: type II toxin-antitoxin system HicA family toxin [Chloroflexota bacterium]|nr:type II toxin-antitoxin system HicA family toxin [Chloroflexota bacterium]MDE2960169.1 type II toxin-antitoxin system HicA family toxin [Chloroflexota bacterium]
MDSRTVIRRLRQDGWYVHHITGSHHQMKHPTKRGTTSVPHPRKYLKVGTIRSIERQSGVRLRP